MYDANLDMQVPDEFGLCHPPLVDLHPVEAYHRAKKIRTVSQESPMLASRPGPSCVIPSVDDLNPLPPSAGLHGFASRHQDLMGAKEREFRKITFLQSQLKQASKYVNRLKCDLQFVDRYVLAAQPSARDCNLPQSPRDVDREDFSNLPFADRDDEESPWMTPIRPTPKTTIKGSTLKSSIGG